MNKRYRKTSNDPIVNFFVMLGSAIWQLVKFFVSLIFGKKKEVFDKVENLKKWRKIEVLLENKDVIHAQQAVIKADKFFDSILRQAGARGKNFAQKLKNFENCFSKENYNLVWQAHKLRNLISHEENHIADIADCKKALDKYKKGLINLKAL